MDEFSSQENNNSSILITILSIATVILLLLCAAGGYMYYQQSSELDGLKEENEWLESENEKLAEQENQNQEIVNKINESELQQDSSAISNWETYENEECGFRIKYPEDWFKVNISSDPKFIPKVTLSSVYKDVHGWIRVIFWDDDANIMNVNLMDDFLEKHKETKKEAEAEEELFISEHLEYQIDKVIIDGMRGYETCRKSKMIKTDEVWIEYELFFPDKNSTNEIFVIEFASIDKKADAIYELAKKVANSFEFIE